MLQIRKRSLFFLQRIYLAQHGWDRKFLIQFPSLTLYDRINSFTFNSMTFSNPAAVSRMNGILGHNVWCVEFSGSKWEKNLERIFFRHATHRLQLEYFQRQKLWHFFVFFLEWRMNALLHEISLAWWFSVEGHEFNWINPWHKSCYIKNVGWQFNGVFN